MLAKVKSLTNKISKIWKRSQPFKSMRETSSYAGATTGLFFFLGSISATPLRDKFGYWPSILTFATRAVTFLNQAQQNHYTSHPDFIKDTDSQIESSMRMIQEKLLSHRNTSNIFSKLHLSPETIATLSNRDADPIALKAALSELYDKSQGKFTKAKKYSASFVFAVWQMVNYYGEYMLAQVYGNADPNPYYAEYDLRKLPNHILMSALAFLALYQALQTFIETKTSYQQPTPESLRYFLFHALENDSELENAQVNRNPPPNPLVIQ